jgi:hypothetical protein
MGTRRARLTENDDAAAGVAHFQIVRQDDGRYHWELINPRGTPAARSIETYATEEDALAAARHAQHLIGNAPIKRA